MSNVVAILEGVRNLVCPRSNEQISSKTRHGASECWFHTFVTSGIERTDTIIALSTERVLGPMRNRARFNNPGENTGGNRSAFRNRSIQTLTDQKTMKIKMECWAIATAAFTILAATQTLGAETPRHRPQNRLILRPTARRLPSCVWHRRSPHRSRGTIRLKSS